MNCQVYPNSEFLVYRTKINIVLLKIYTDNGTVNNILALELLWSGTRLALAIHPDHIYYDVHSYSQLASQALFALVARMVGLCLL